MTAVAPVRRWPQMKRDGLLCNFYSERRRSRATQKRTDLLLFKVSPRLAALRRGRNAIFKLHRLLHPNIWNISLTLLLRAARLFHRNSLRLSVKDSSSAPQKKKKKKHKAVWIMWASARLCFWCVQNPAKIFPVALYVAALLRSPVCALSGVMSWGMRNRCARDVWTSRPLCPPHPTPAPTPPTSASRCFMTEGMKEGGRAEKTQKGRGGFPRTSKTRPQNTAVWRLFPSHSEQNMLRLQCFLIGNHSQLIKKCFSAQIYKDKKIKASSKINCLYEWVLMLENEINICGVVW